MPYGQEDNTKMAAFLGGLRNAFGGGGQGQPQQPLMTDEEKQIRLAALQRLGQPQVDPAKVAALQKSFFGQ